MRAALSLAFAALLMGMPAATAVSRGESPQLGPGQACIATGPEPSVTIDPLYCVEIVLGILAAVGAMVCPLLPPEIGCNPDPTT